MPEQRKVVTVLFCDMAGSTSLGERLDPEALRVLLARWFERMKEIVERHGGTVEKFIGDAVMAVFGVPHLHEDDALRACRAALEMQGAMPELGVEGRIGVMTGEVVSGTEERLVTGDAVNVAARLEQAAAPGEVLIGEPTLLLVRDAEVEKVDALSLKGKSAPVAAYRLLAVSQATGRRLQGPIVGRAGELARLDALFAESVGARTCRFATIVGAPGVGKSRLAAEFVSGVDARVVTGRCLSYGEGITYWPVVEIVKQLGIRPEPEAAAAAIAALLGESDAGTDPDDIAWAFRRTLEAAAARRPLVCLLDDLHWAEPALLDLVEYVGDVARDAPILLLCLARPDLVDERPGWSGEVLPLAPLTPEESDELLAQRGGDDAGLRARIVAAAEGNPLFLEEMLALAHESGETDVRVPATIQSLLAARLDALDPAERTLLERGAVEGLLFHVRGLKALLDEGEVVTPRLQALVRRDLIRPAQPVVRGGDAYRFRHQLIRDAAYEALPKSTRADLHRRFGAWLAEAGSELVELDELVGYHLEQSCGYRLALGDSTVPEVAREARRRLTAAGRRAARRGDYSAAALLGERAFALVPAGEFDLELELDVQWALFYSGQIERSVRWGGEARARAAAHADALDVLCVRASEAVMRNFLEPEGSAARLRAIVDEALPVLTAAGHEVGLTTVWMAAYLAAHGEGRVDDAVEAADRVLELSRRCGRISIEEVAIVCPAMSRQAGSLPAPEFLAWLATRDEATRRNRPIRAVEALALAMVGRVEEGRELIDSVLAELDETPVGFTHAWALSWATEFDVVAGGAAASYDHAREAVRLSEQIGARASYGGALASLAEAACELGRLDEAAQALAGAEEAAPADDPNMQWMCRRAAAMIRARRGELDEAERLAREAVALGDGTQFLHDQARTYVVLAEVLMRAGKIDAATEALGEAVSRFERKGDVVGAARARALLPVAVT